MISWTKFIGKHLKEEYERMGWTVSDSLKGTPHGEWSYIGVWKGEGKPPLPESEKNAT